MALICMCTLQIGADHLDVKIDPVVNAMASLLSGIIGHTPRFRVTLPSWAYEITAPCHVSTQVQELSACCAHCPANMSAKMNL